MSKEKLNAIKEIESRVNRVKELCDNGSKSGDPLETIDLIDNLLFDIQDFINDLKDE